MLQNIYAALDAGLGLGLEAKHLNAGHMALRAVLVFAIATIFIRLGHKRFMGQSTAMDVMLGIVFGSLASRAISGNAPFFPVLAAALTLVICHWLAAALCFHSHTAGRVVKGKATVLVREGQIDWEEMRRGHITEHDLKEAMRMEGEEPDVRQLKQAHLERNGDISIITKP